MNSNIVSLFCVAYNYQVAVLVSEIPPDGTCSESYPEPCKFIHAALILSSRTKKRKRDNVRYASSAPQWTGSAWSQGDNTSSL